MEEKIIKLRPQDVPELWESVPAPRRPFSPPAALEDFEYDLPEITEEDEKLAAEWPDLVSI